MEAPMKNNGDLRGNSQFFSIARSRRFKISHLGPPAAPAITFTSADLNPDSFIFEYAFFPAQNVSGL
jgi:hypothetical protein